MGEDFKRAVASTLIRQEKRIAMLEMTLSSLLLRMEDKAMFSEVEIDDLFDSAKQLTEHEVKDRIEQVCEAFGLTVQ